MITFPLDILHTLSSTMIFAALMFHQFVLFCVNLSLQIKDITEVPLAYLPGNISRIKVTAVGDLVTHGQEKTSARWQHKDPPEVKQESQG